MTNALEVALHEAIEDKDVGDLAQIIVFTAARSNSSEDMRFYQSEQDELYWERCYPKLA